MMKLIGLILGFALAAVVGWQVVYAQTPSPSPTPTPTPSPTPTTIIDGDGEVLPEGAPETGYGGLSR